MIRTLLVMAVATVLSSASVCAQTPKQEVVLNGTNVRLRLEPNLQCGWLKDSKGAPTYLKKGTKLPYKDETSDFYEVSYKGQTLYVSKQFSYIEGKQKTGQPAPVNVSVTSRPMPNALQSGTKTEVTLTGTNVYLRLGPGTNYDYLKNDKGAPRYVPKGTKLKCTGEKGEFYKCELEGNIVYVSKRYAK